MDLLGGVKKQPKAHLHPIETKGRNDLPPLDLAVCIAAVREMSRIVAEFISCESR
jgi:hypothetical protein